MEEKWLALFQSNCTRLISQALANSQLHQIELSNRNLTTTMSGVNSNSRHHHHLTQTNVTTNQTSAFYSMSSFATATAQSISSSQYSTLSSSGYAYAPSLSPSDSSQIPASYADLQDEQISSLFMQQMMQNSKKIVDQDSLLLLGTGGGSDLGTDEYVNTEPIASQQQYDHIIQSHSESARNALIYIAVILSIYLIAVAAIAIQYYRKHSTLDPFSAYLFGRNKGNKDHRHHRHHRSGMGGPRPKRRRSTGIGDTNCPTSSNLPEVRVSSSNVSVRTGNGSNGAGGVASGNSPTDGVASTPTELNTAPVGVSNGGYAAENGPLKPVAIQINIEQVDSDNWTNLEVIKDEQRVVDTVQPVVEDTEDDEEEYYDEEELMDEDEEPDDEVDDEYDTDDEIFDLEKQKPKKGRLKKLFNFGVTPTTPPPPTTPSANQSTANVLVHHNDNHSAAAIPTTTSSHSSSIKFLMRSLSLNSSSESTPVTGGETDSNAFPQRRPTNTNIRFKRSTSSGFTNAATSLFKSGSTSSQKYEETHL